MMNAPVLVLGYNRPKHLQLALLALSSNRESKFTEVYISIDGPRNSSEAILINDCRKIASLDYNFLSTKLVFNEFNQGLAKNVITNVSNILKNHDSIIVVEDDLVVSKHFLKYMNLGLQKYQVEKSVASIHGYQYPIGQFSKQCVFLRGADCWGWATWKDRWDSVEFNVDILLKQINVEGIRKSFDLGGFQSNYKLLVKQKKGEVDSWAIRWHASMFIQNRLTLYPPESLVVNTGLDGSGIHESISNIFDTELSGQSEWVFPVEIEESKNFVKLLRQYFKQFHHKKFSIRFFKDFIKKMVKSNG